MPNISKRGMQMPPSPIRKLVGYAEEAAKRGISIYNLNIGQPDVPTPGHMIDALTQADLTVVAYSHSAGNQSYREKLVQYYNRFDIDLDVSDLLVTTGGSEAILFAFMSCLDPGDEIIIPEPFYANYNGFAIAAGVTIKPLTSYIEDDFALPDVSGFSELVTDKTKAILLCNPSNPTGYMYTKEELEALKELALEHDLFLFVDEVYREFCYDGRTHFSALNLTGMEDKVVIVDSISKRFSSCGARIGTMVSRNTDVMKAALKFGQARLSPPTFGQIAAEASLDLPESYLEEVKEEYLSRRDAVVQALQAMDGVTCPNPGGAFYAMAALPIDDADVFCQWLLTDFDYEGETVMLAPASGFYATSGLGKNEVRIAFVLNKDKMGKAMECLDAAIKVYPGRTEVVATEA
jgi:aspartate aminotransferase